MAQITPRNPQSAADYDDRTTAAVKAVLIEIGQVLGSFKGKYAVIGGAVPWLLLGREDMPHVGTLDVDLGLDAEALGDGEYATLIEALQGHGYQQRRDLRRFQLVRQVSTNDGGAPIDVIVLVRKAGKSRADARNALSSWRDAFPVIETSLDVMLVAADLAVDHNLGIWDAVILSVASRSGCRLLLSEDLQEDFTWAGVTVVNPFSVPQHALLQALL